VLLSACGHILVASAQAARLLDVDGPESLAGRTALFDDGIAIHADGTAFPTKEQPASVALRTGEKQEDVVVGVKRPGAETRWFLMQAEPLFNAGGATPYAAMARFVALAGPSPGRRYRSAGIARVTRNVHPPRYAA
jgi:hypothetical protein